MKGRPKQAKQKIVVKVIHHPNISRINYSLYIFYRVPIDIYKNRCKT